LGGLRARPFGFSSAHAPAIVSSAMTVRLSERICSYQL
jgi:hypothetical protein